MANNASNLVVGANGTIYTAPAGTALPTTTTGVLNVAFSEVGYLTEDGGTFTYSEDTQDILAWQEEEPIDTLITGRNATYAFACREWNKTSVELAFGGAKVTKEGEEYRLDAPTTGSLDRRALVVDWEFREVNYRLVIPRGIASGDVSSTINRTSTADLPVSFKATPGSAESRWYILTNGTNLAS